MEEKSHQEKAAEILFQITRKANSPTSSLDPKSIEKFFSNPENIKKLEKKFDKNLIELLEYLLERKRNKKNTP